MPPKTRTEAAASLSQATLQDVASVAGVSHMTVSRFLRTPDLLSEATRAKVAAAVDALGYIPNQAAAGLVTDKSRVVVLIVPNISVPLFHGVFVGASQALNPEVYTLLVSETGQDKEREMKVARSALGWRPSAIISVGGFMTDKASAMIRDSRVLHCAVLKRPGRSADLSVDFSNFQSGEAVANHLLKSGKRHICFVRAPGTWIDRLKLQRDGAQAAVAAIPGASLETLAVKSPYPLNMDSGVEALHAALAMQQRPDALMFSSDIPAAGALLECARLGIAVPGEMSIVGFGDYEIGRHLHPALSTIHVDAHAIGRIAGELIRATLAAQPIQQKNIDIGFQLMVRGSS